MIHTKEPANQFYVLVSAARSNLTDAENEQRHIKLANQLAASPSLYGSVEATSLIGSYLEEGQQKASTERTIRLLCETKQQAFNVTMLACTDYQQDCVMLYRSQTHSARLYFYDNMEMRSVALNGSFSIVTEPNTEEGWTVDENGTTWQVV